MKDKDMNKRKQQSAGACLVRGFSCLLIAGSLLWVAACSDDVTGTPQDGGPLDGSRDGPLTKDSVPDATKVTAPKTDPTLVTVAQWMVGWIPSTMTSDPVYAALGKGTFTYPKAGYDANNVHWSSRAPGKSGALGSFPAGVSYAAAKINLSAPARLFIRSGPTLGVSPSRISSTVGVFVSTKPLMFAFPPMISITEFKASIRPSSDHLGKSSAPGR